MDRLGQFALGAGVTAFYHPIAYAKVLIQVGYEPLPPVPSTTLFGSKVLKYPNIFKYMGHIWTTDGFWGLYRGLAPRLLSNIVGSVVANAVAAELIQNEMPEASEVKPNEAPKDIKKLAVDYAYESISKCAGIIASQPFHVIVVRSMCQFVGKETKYSTVMSSISEIWNNEGILGFFSGLMPRLLGELLAIWLVHIVTDTVNTYVFPATQPHSKELRIYSNVFCQMMVTQISYPFNITSNVMAVNNSGLSAGSPPITLIYSSWWDCWTQLSQQKQIKRGSSLFWRYYRAPILIIN